MSSKSHWESIHATRPVDQAGWFQTEPTESIALIRQNVLRKTARIIDIGVGASSLLDFLLTEHYLNITVLDISATALNRAKMRHGTRASQVNWIEADVITAVLPIVHYDLWHDRSVFHFLTSREDRHRYVETIADSLKPGGHVILATAAKDGPTQCSGLEVMRYSPQELQCEFGIGFQLIGCQSRSQHTSSNTRQNFIYCHFRKL